MNDCKASTRSSASRSPSRWINLRGPFGTDTAGRSLERSFASWDFTMSMSLPSKSVQGQELEKLMSRSQGRDVAGHSLDGHSSADILINKTAALGEVGQL